MEQRIQATLDQIERSQNVRILYAVESGSRAWGFESADSDYDVRFIYSRGPREYLKLSPSRDVIELPIQPGDLLDVNGWDIIKTLQQFRRSNPTLCEWLCSPIVYREVCDTASILRKMATEYGSRKRMAYHYLSMARQNYRLAIQNKPEVTTKKYLYVLRPLMCVRWIETRETPPPTRMSDVQAAITLPVDVTEKLAELLERKRMACEWASEAHEPIFDDYIEREIARLDGVIDRFSDTEMPVEPLDALLWSTLNI